MIPPPDYTFDPQRLAALADHAILDTEAEQGFHDIARLAAQLCDAPVALVSFVAAERQWFKARIGFEPYETALDSSVCAHALIEPDLLIIPDLRHDDRTRANPLVTGDPYIRFYAGAPFRAATGEVLGSLCVIDDRARPNGLEPAQASALRILGRLVSTQLELRRAILDREAFAAEQIRAAARRAGLLQLGDQLRDMTSAADMTRAAAAIVGEILNVSRAAFGRLEGNGEYVAIEPDWTAPGVKTIAGRYRFADYGDLGEGLLHGDPLIIEDVHRDPRTAASAHSLFDLGIGSLVNMPVRERGRTVAVFIVHDAQPRVWTIEMLSFLRNVADRLEAGIARLNAETEQQVLNNELRHRLKNTFAMIQAIASQTLRALPEQDVVDSFIRRLHTMASANDILLQQKWLAAKMFEVVTTVLKTLAEPARFTISGPDINLGPKATLSVSLLLHELTTNALKYGSLSRDSGRVQVNWHVSAAQLEPALVMTWREIDGPPVGQPNSKGFGSRLLRMGLVGTGGVDLRYLTSGFEAEFTAPLAQVLHSEGGGVE